ncbi:uncharacterized protein LOC118079398 [Zootoca vivipara]|uniref:uncharacterized protein LOC118079398 n=1 Tax=Zootoca vivipara TaxID=8524 RepID=UPI00293BD71A|nr:uncharacterized protein LOC118079398 [Zootoca vivipara]
MDAEQAEQEVHVQAAVGIRQIPGSLKQDSFLVVNKDSNRLIFISKADKGVQEGCFTIDGVFSLDTGQDKLFLEQLQPLLAMVPLGYSVSLLVCEAHHDGTQTQIQAFVQKVIESVLQETSSAKNCTQYLQTITFVQIYTDGKAQDLLSPRSRVLQVMDLPPLGLMVEEAAEVVVANSQAATHCYLQGMSLHQSCLQKSFQEQHKAAICGNLFTITMETKAESGQGLQRATVKIFEFSGGNEQHSPDPFLPLFRASSAAALPADDTGFLCWMLKHLLEENALTFLLLCLTLPDASGEEIRSAISLTEQVRTVTKRVSPVHWDPTHEAQKRREVIGELRAQLAFRSRMDRKDILSQLEVVIKEIQVLKSQRWKKKKEASATYEAKDTSPEGRSMVGEQHQETKGRFSQAKARWQVLQEQHHLLIQQELLRMEEELASQELPPGQQGAMLWQKEKSLLILRMEALQREQAEAGRDLEVLYQECQRETETQKQHILQVFQGYRKHAEEHIDVLEQRYRKLLQESLQDAILLSTQNQQLQAQKQLGYMEKATQTDFQTLTRSHETASPS